MLLSEDRRISNSHAVAPAYISMIQDDDRKERAIRTEYLDDSPGRPQS